MKKFLTLAVAMALALGVGSAVYANVCAVDQVPAATILFPFVSFNYNSGDQGATTLFAVTNVSSDAQIVHFVLWSDYSMHVLDWDVVLSGYDVVTMNIRDILAHGMLPSSGTADGDAPDSVIYGGDTPGELGPVNDPDTWAQLADPMGTINLAARCPAGGLHYPNYGPILPGILARVQEFLTASQVVDRAVYSCSQDDYYNLSNYWFQDRTAADDTWMYITADVVWSCNGDFPDLDPAYWSNDHAANGEAMYDNVLMGDVFHVDTENNFSEALGAVHLEADVDLPGVVTWDPNSDYTAPITFYTQYVQSLGTFNNTTAPYYGDFREPLPQAWGFRWLNNQLMGTQVRVFKRATNNFMDPVGSGAYTFVQDLELDLNGYFDYSAAATDPPAFMAAWDCIPYTYYVWDEDENPATAIGNQGGPSCPPNTPDCITPKINLFPLETQEVDISQLRLPSASAGWAMLIWPWANAGNASAIPLDVFQTYVSVRYSALGRFSAELQATVLANYACFSDQMIGRGMGVNYDYVLPGGVYTTSP